MAARVLAKLLGRSGACMGPLLCVKSCHASSLMTGSSSVGAAAAEGGVPPAPPAVPLEVPRRLDRSVKFCCTPGMSAEGAGLYQEGAFGAKPTCNKGINSYQRTTCTIKAEVALHVPLHAHNSGKQWLTDCMA